MTRSFIAIITLLILIGIPLSAQDDAALTPLTAEAGFIAQRGETQRWTFSAQAGEVYSILLEASTQTLDPVLTIRDANGDTVISNDDYDYPDTLNALVEAITIPETGTYTVAVSGFGETTGGYRLSLLPGYGRIAGRDDFDNTANWTVSGADTAEISAEDGDLVLFAEGVDATAHATSTTAAKDFYAQVDVTGIVGDNWTVGMTVRGQGDTYYLYSISSQGNWRFTAIEGDSERVIRDFTQHPAIIAGETDFTLAVLAHATGFEMFYNGQAVGQMLDDALNESGEIGLFTQSANAIGSQVRVRFNNFAVTTPVETNGNPVFPQQIILESRPQQIIQALERRRVIPPGGSLPLTVTESFVDSTQPGVIVQPLGRGATFEHFVMGTTTRLSQSGVTGVAGCGLLLQQTGAENYTVAFVDREGGFGVSQRNGETFAEGIFDTRPDWADNDSHNLIVVINDGQLHYFVNGVYAGQLAIDPINGEVGNVLLNYDAVESRCQFDDTWLWRLN